MPRKLRRHCLKSLRCLQSWRDLELFRQAITRRERTALVHYGRQCVDTLYRWWQNCSLPLTTISLVQGDALGAALSVRCLAHS